MESWLATNEVLATTTASATTPGFSSGTVVAPTDGSTTGAATEAAFKSMLQSCWTQGGNARVILVGASQHAAIDAFSGIAPPRYNVNQPKPVTLIGTASMYVSPFGPTHTIVLHRHVRSSVILGIDPEYWSLAFLDTPFMEQLAKTGDGTKYQIIAEWGLVCRNETASGKVVACG